jgi:hypothetical protein
MKEFFSPIELSQTLNAGKDMASSLTELVNSNSSFSAESSRLSLVDPATHTCEQLRPVEAVLLPQ